MSSKLTKRQLAGQVIVDDVGYTWQLDREPRASSSDGVLGVAITVMAIDGARNLLLELPNPKSSRNRVMYHRRPKITPIEIETGIRAALLSGWKPFSRGKVFRFRLS